MIDTSTLPSASIRLLRRLQPVRPRPRRRRARPRLPPRPAPVAAWKPRDATVRTGLLLAALAAVDWARATWKGGPKAGSRRRSDRRRARGKTSSCFGVRDLDRPPSSIQDEATTPTAEDPLLADQLAACEARGGSGTAGPQAPTAATRSAAGPRLGERADAGSSGGRPTGGQSRSETARDPATQWPADPMQGMGSYGGQRTTLGPPIRVSLHGTPLLKRRRPREGVRRAAWDVSLTQHQRRHPRPPRRGGTPATAGESRPASPIHRAWSSTAADRGKDEQQNLRATLSNRHGPDSLRWETGRDGRGGATGKDTPPHPLPSSSELLSSSSVVYGGAPVPRRHTASPPKRHRRSTASLQGQGPGRPWRPLLVPGGRDSGPHQPHSSATRPFRPTPRPSPRTDHRSRRGQPSTPNVYRARAASRASLRPGGPAFDGPRPVVPARASAGGRCSAGRGGSSLAPRSPPRGRGQARPLICRFRRCR